MIAVWGGFCKQQAIFCQQQEVCLVFVVDKVYYTARNKGRNGEIFLSTTGMVRYTLFLTLEKPSKDG
jgi:hypothetical protein